MFAIVGEATIYYEIEGPFDAPALVLSNSLGTDISMWRWQLDALTGPFRVVRYDSPGHGRSQTTEAPYTVELLARDVIGLADHLELERFSICGVSLGGGVGIWLAAHAPACVEKLVVANTASHFDSPESWNARIEAIRNEGMASIADAVVERWFTPTFRERCPAEVEGARRMLLAVPAEGYIACCEAVRDGDLRADLASMRTPTLVIGGTDDPAVPPDKCRAMADAIDGARFIELPSAHLSNIEAAEAFNSAVLKFLTT